MYVFLKGIWWCVADVRRAKCDAAFISKGGLVPWGWWSTVRNLSYRISILSCFISYCSSSWFFFIYTILRTNLSFFPYDLSYALTCWFEEKKKKFSTENLVIWRNRGKLRKGNTRANLLVITLGVLVFFSSLTVIRDWSGRIIKTFKFSSNFFCFGFSPPFIFPTHLRMWIL